MCSTNATLSSPAPRTSHSGTSCPLKHCATVWPSFIHADWCKHRAMDLITSLQAVGSAISTSQIPQTLDATTARNKLYTPSSTWPKTKFPHRILFVKASVQLRTSSQSVKSNLDSAWIDNSYLALAGNRARSSKPMKFLTLHRSNRSLAHTPFVLPPTVSVARNTMAAQVDTSAPSLPGGVYTALVTPFTEDGSAVDHEALSLLVEAQIAGGVVGVVPVRSACCVGVVRNSHPTRFHFHSAAQPGRIPHFLEKSEKP